MKQHAFTLLILLLFILPIAVFSQSSQINIDQIAEGENIFEYEQITGDSSLVFGTISERINREKNNGTLVITITQELPNATLTDSINFDADSFQPLRYQTIVPGMQNILIEYTIPGLTVINMQRNIPGQLVDTTMFIQTDQIVYDFHWPHILISGLNSLEQKDDVINLPVFTYQTQQTMQSISYKGEETINLNDKSYDCISWKTSNPMSGVENSYWIDQNTHRLIQNKATLTNGMIFWLKRKE